MIDRRAVMLDAHRRYRQGQRLGMGWTFAQCLKTAWAAAKQRQGAARQLYQPGPVRRMGTPFPAVPAAIAAHRDFIRL